MKVTGHININAATTVGSPAGEVPPMAVTVAAHHTFSGPAVIAGAALMYGFRMRRRERRLKSSL